MGALRSGSLYGSQSPSCPCTARSSFKLLSSKSITNHAVGCPSGVIVHHGDVTQTGVYLYLSLNVIYSAVNLSQLRYDQPTTPTMAKALKRRRKNRATDNTDDSTRVTITCLPFELIAEILLYSNSLTDVLSLSRTCKHFNATLVQNPVAAFIWKRVRAQATLPIPDPTVFGFSEPELANFIYGGGKCTVRPLLSALSLFMLTSCYRYAESARKICTRRSPLGFASVGTRSVA